MSEGTETAIVHTQSVARMKEACLYSPGGVHSSIRVVPFDLVYDHAEGAYLWDLDGNEYVDYSAAFAAIILGHADQGVDQAVYDAVRKLDLVGMGTSEYEIQAAQKVVQHLPGAEMVLFCNTGSEATYHAVRLARAVTGRNRLIKFQGCYHGWHDYLLMNVRSSPDRIGQKDPLSAGMLPAAVDATTVLEFNDVQSAHGALQTKEYAAVILEPIAHNMGCVLPTQEFIQGLRDSCTETGTILIFDEVITGFRHGLGGCQGVLEVLPDLTTLGKAMSNGYPCAAVAGKRDLMMEFATAGGFVHFSGTHNAHPVGTAAAVATIAALEDGKIHQHLFAMGDYARQGLCEIRDRLRIPLCVAGYGSIFVPYFMDPALGLPQNYSALLQSDMNQDENFRLQLVDQGILVFPRPLTRMTMTASHTHREIDRMLEIAEAALRTMFWK